MVPKIIKMNDEHRGRLRSFKSDCSGCSGLCCCALFFSDQDGFPEDKPAGKPCVNLDQDYRCKIYDDLESQGMKGCIGFDCFNAGFHVTQNIYGGQSVTEDESKAKEMNEVFVIVRHLFEIRYFLSVALAIIPVQWLWNDVAELIEENIRICDYSPGQILNADTGGYRERAGAILNRACKLIKTDIQSDSVIAQTVVPGTSMKGRNLSGLDLSNKLLIAINFQKCNFQNTILLGADTRDADFGHADLRNALFLTQGQINSAKGNRWTKLPDYLEYPRTWMD